MPPWQDAISALAPIMGGAGISGIVVALLGFLVSSRRGGRPAGEVPPVAGVIVSAEDVKLIANSLMAAATAFNRCADTLERVLRATHEVADMARVVAAEARGVRDEMERSRRED